jgi:hypothetical protein
VTLACANLFIGIITTVTTFVLENFDDEELKAIGSVLKVYSTVQSVDQGRCTCALIKKKIKFSSLYQEIQKWSSCKIIYMRKGFLIYEEMRKYLAIYEYEEAVSHI